MNWFKKWVLCPIYWVLYSAVVLLMLAMLVTIGVGLYQGSAGSVIYAEVAPLCSLYSLTFLGAYYLKWEYIYGPQKKQELKDAITEK